MRRGRGPGLRSVRAAFVLMATAFRAYCKTATNEAGRHGWRCALECAPHRGSEQNVRGGYSADREGQRQKHELTKTFRARLPRPQFWWFMAKLLRPTSGGHRGRPSIAHFRFPQNNGSAWRSRVEWGKRRWQHGRECGDECTCGRGGQREITPMGGIERARVGSPRTYLEIGSSDRQGRGRGGTM